MTIIILAGLQYCLQYLSVSTENLPFLGHFHEKLLISVAESDSSGASSYCASGARAPRASRAVARQNLAENAVTAGGQCLIVGHNHI